MPASSRLFHNSRESSPSSAARTTSAGQRSRRSRPTPSSSSRSIIDREDTYRPWIGFCPMESKTVLSEVADGVGLITLNRPERSNAWTGRMAFEYRTAMHQADQDERVGAIVVTGAGRHFCVGADNKALDGFAQSGKYDSGIRETPPDPGDPAHPAYGTAFGFPLAVSKPVIAAVNGAAAGVGFIAACFADIRFGATDAKWTPATSKLGLPAEYAISWILPRLIGYGRAVEWMLSSRPVLSEEAKAMGLVHAVHPAEQVLEAALN